VFLIQNFENTKFEKQHFKKKLASWLASLTFVGQPKIFNSLSYKGSTRPVLFLTNQYLIKLICFVTYVHNNDIIIHLHLYNIYIYIYIYIYILYLLFSVVYIHYIYDKRELKYLYFFIYLIFKI